MLVELATEGALEYSIQAILVLEFGEAFMPLDTNLPVVELRPASAWTCEHCGVDNFARQILVTREEVESASFTDDEDERQQMLDMLGRGLLTRIPNTVECRECHKRYRTMEPGTEASEDWNV